MNRIARTALIALPLSVAALTATTGTAHAETPPQDPGPVIVMPSEPVQPGPGEIANPTPEPPKDIANPEPDPAPVPDDKAPLPQDDPDPAPEGPGDITDTPDCTHGCQEDPTPDLPLDSGEGDEGEGDDGTGDDGTGGDTPEEPQDPKQDDDTEVAQFETEVAGVVTPTRVDAGLGGGADGGLELTWLLAGGALVTASGAAFAARKRTRSRS